MYCTKIKKKNQTYNTQQSSLQAKCICYEQVLVEETKLYYAAHKH